MKRAHFWWVAGLAIWLVILLVPPLNLLFRVQLLGSDSIRFSVTPASQSQIYFWENAARRFPNDLNILMQAAQENPFGDEETPTQPSQIFPEQEQTNSPIGVLRRLDYLLQKFPNDTTLLALRLQIAFSNMRGGRIGGEFSDSDFDKNQAAGKPSPEKSKEPPTYTTAELQRAMALAARGQKLEPNNGYFDWMQACFSILAWRDQAAFNALDASARKKRFDDYGKEMQKAKLQARATALGRPLLWEEKLQLQASTMFPQYARYREMARVFSWQSLKAQRRGNHALALRIAAGMGRTGARMRENAKTHTAGLVAVALEAVAWSGPVWDARRRIGGRFAPAQRIALFSDYATKYGRAKLGAEAGKNGLAAAAFRAKVTSSFDAFYNVSFGEMVAAQSLWLLSVSVLLLLPIALLLLLFKPILRRAPRVPGVLRWRNSKSDEMPDAREVRNGALACGGVRALGTLLAGIAVVALCAAGLTTGAGESNQMLEGLSDFWKGGMDGDYWWGLYSWNFAETPAQWRWVLALTPLLFGGLHCAWRATQWQKRADGENNFSLLMFFKPLFTGHAFEPARAKHNNDFDFGGAALKLMNFVFMVLLSGFWLFLAFVPPDNESFSSTWMGPLAMVFLFAVLSLITIVLDWRKRPRRAAAIRYGLRLFHRSLAVWLVLGSAFYLLTLLVSLPLRARIEKRIDRAIEIGEVKAAVK